MVPSPAADRTPLAAHFATSGPSSLMTLAIVAGSLTVLAVVAGFTVWMAWPTRLACPACGAPTVPVTERSLPEIIARHAWLRWCGECGWEGLARRGPDLTEGPVDHESGFRWNPDPADGAPVFVWGDTGEVGDADGAEPRASSHPSGLAWADPGEPGDPPAHASGFRWRSARDPIRFRPSPEGLRPPGSDDPSGFRWAEDDRA